MIRAEIVRIYGSAIPEITRSNLSFLIFQIEVKNIKKNLIGELCLIGIECVKWIKVL